MSIPDPRDYGLPEDAIPINIGGQIRDLRTVHPNGGSEEDERQALLAGSHLLPAPESRPPEPGTGAVWISPVQGSWFAVWDHAVEGEPEVRHREGPEGMSRAEAIRWALDQPAERRMIYDDAQQDFRELDDEWDLSTD